MSLKIPEFKQLITCIIDENVNFSKIVQGRLDNLVTELDRVIISYSNSSFWFNLLDYDISSWGVFALSNRRWTQVINYDFSPSAGIEQSISFTQPSSSSRDNNDFIFKFKWHLQ